MKSAKPVPARKTTLWAMVHRTEGWIAWTGMRRTRDAMDYQRRDSDSSYRIAQVEIREVLPKKRRKRDA